MRHPQAERLAVRDAPDVDESLGASAEEHLAVRAEGEAGAQGVGQGPLRAAVGDAPEADGAVAGCAGQQATVRVEGDGEDAGLVAL